MISPLPHPLSHRLRTSPLISPLRSSPLAQLYLSYASELSQLYLTIISDLSRHYLSFILPVLKQSLCSPLLIPSRLFAEWVRTDLFQSFRFAIPTGLICSGGGWCRVEKGEFLRLHCSTYVSVHRFSTHVRTHLTLHQSLVPTHEQFGVEQTAVVKPLQCPRM